MTLSEAYKYDFQPYFSHFPFFSNTIGQLDGNAILYAGTYGLLYAKLFGDYSHAPEHATALYMMSYYPCQPGVISRGPHKWEDPQTHDDYIGLATLSALNGGGAARAFYNYGHRNLWSFNRAGNKNPADWFNSQFWRLAGVPQHIKLCAGKKWSWLDKALWASSVFFNSFSNGESGKILTWHFVSMYERLGKKNSLCDAAVRIWKKRLQSRYPAGMGSVFEIYYGKAHPFAKWAQGVL